MLSKEPHRTVFAFVHLIHQRIRVLGQTCSENDQFIVLGHYFQEVVDARSLLHEDVADGALDVNWNDVIRGLDLVELRVH